MAEKHDDDSIEWNVENKRALYQVLKAIRAVTDMEYIHMYEAAHGSMIGHGNDDRDNFRRGVLATGKVEKFYQWMMAHYFALGSEIAPHLFNPSLMNGWMRLMRDTLTYDQLQIVKAAGLNLTTRSHHTPISDTTIKLGEQYVFTLDCTIDGMLLAFEGYKGQWHPISLHHNALDLLTPWQSGMHTLPTKADGMTLEPLVDTDSAGLHRFVFIIAPMDIFTDTVDALALNHPANPKTLNSLADTLATANPATWQIHGLNVVFAV